MSNNETSGNLSWVESCKQLSQLHYLTQHQNVLLWLQSADLRGKWKGYMHTPATMCLERMWRAKIWMLNKASLLKYSLQGFHNVWWLNCLFERILWCIKQRLQNVFINLKKQAFMFHILLQNTSPKADWGAGEEGKKESMKLANVQSLFFLPRLSFSHFPLRISGIWISFCFINLLFSDSNKVTTIIYWAGTMICWSLQPPSISQSSAWHIRGTYYIFEC